MLSFYEGIGVGDLRIEESEVLCTNSTALISRQVMGEGRLGLLLKRQHAYAEVPETIMLNNNT
jgi:hypothetical protein